MRAIIFWFDRWLSKRYGIYPIQNGKDSFMRIQLTRASHPVQLPGCEVKAANPILAMHLWNEYIPVIPPDGPDLGWARKVQRLFIGSLQAIAREMQSNPRLSDVQAVQAESVLLSLTGGERLIRRLGFVILPSHNPLGRFGEFWENLYTWSLMWAYNPVSLYNRHLLDLRREELWMAADEFVYRFGSNTGIRGSVEQDRVAVENDIL
jgi:YkoP domain